MTTQTNSTRPADPTIAYPAVHHDGDYTWKRATRTKSIIGWSVFTLAFALANIYLLVVTEEEYVIVISRVIEVPAVALTGLGSAVGLVLLVVAFRPLAPWYQDWSYLEVLEEADGIRVLAGRLGKDDAGVKLSSGDTLELSATRGDSLDEAELVARGPGGKLEVDVDTYLSSLTVAPLERAAAAHGIKLRFTGVATEIPRAVPEP